VITVGLRSGGMDEVFMPLSMGHDMEFRLTSGLLLLG
jgi:hypothetical protein